MKYASRIYIGIILAILYIPILTLILFSFNASESTSTFVGFDIRWYVELFNSPEAFTALRNTLILAVLSALIATVIGTAAAEGIYKMRSKLAKTAITSVTNIPMMNPDIVTGMSMMLFFAAVVGIFKIADYSEIGFLAMLISHVTFCLPYVILSVLPRLTELGDSLSEAALDLGCTPLQAFIKVKLPNIMPAVLSGAIMAFTLSLDDFVISYFVAPPNFQTLPLLIYSMTKKKVKPDMYALSTIIVVVIFILLLVSNLRSEKKTALNGKKKRIAVIVTASVAIIATVAVIIGSLFTGGAAIGSSEVIYLNVYNWGEYMADGSDSEYGNVNKMFEEYYEAKTGKKVVVNYSTYATNEDLFSKLNNSAVSYDVVIPSDYMIEKLIEADLLLEFDVNSEIPNYQYIDKNFKKPYYDEAERYSVPYTYGMIGIIYNPEMVDAEDVADESWGLLWNEKYAGQILQFNNPRDAFATAMYWKGLDINSDDPAVWDQALELLIEQKPLVKGYVNDEIFDTMTAGSAAIAPYFAGDYITMAETEGAVPLEFYYPTEGANYFVDAMCIPKSSKNPDVAKEYINFMLSEEPAVENAKFIGYASPNTLVSSNADYLDYMGEDACEILYGTEGHNPLDVNEAYNEKYGTTCYKNFTPEIQSRVNTLWENLKLADSTELWIHLLSGGIVIAIVALAVYTTYVKKKRSRAYRLRDKQARLAKQAK